MYNPETTAAICSRLAEGESLRSICRDEGMPSAPTVLAWLKEPDKAEFAEQYTRAREIGYQLLADEILEISDDSAGDVVVSKDGVESTNAERVARSRLRVDSRKWMLSKMLPKVYGEKITQEHTGPDGGPVQIIASEHDEKL